MIDVSQIDLDSLTTLELWELHERVVARMEPDGYDSWRCPADACAYNTYAADARMRSLV